MNASGLRLKLHRKLYGNGMYLPGKPTSVLPTPIFWAGGVDEFRKFDEWHDYIHPDDKEATLKTYYTAIEDPCSEIWKREYRYLKADGGYAFVSDKAVIVRDENGKAIKVIGALKNITVQKETEEELKKSNERFSLASRATSDHIYEWDIVTNELVWGEDSQTLFGFQPQELTMHVWTELLHPEEREKTIRHLTEALADPAKEIWNQEYRLADAHGVYSYILERGFIVRDEARQSPAHDWLFAGYYQPQIAGRITFFGANHI